MLTWTRDETGRDVGTFHGPSVIGAKATAGEGGPTLQVWVFDSRARADVERTMRAAVNKAEAGNGR